MIVEYDKGLYTPRLAAKVARVRYQNFQAWAKANLLTPSLKINWGKKSENIYTYYDLLLIRLIKRLRDRGFKTKTIKKALNVIRDLSGGDPYGWTKATIAIDADLIVVALPGKEEWNPIAASKGPQKMEIIFFPELIEDLRRELVPDRFKLIEVNPVILAGTPVIKGTRIPTHLIYSLSKEGVNLKEAYPNLSEDEIKEANTYEEFLLAG